MTDAVPVLWVTDMANPQPRSGGGLRSLRLVQAVAAQRPVDVVHVGSGLDTAAYLEVSGARSAREMPPDLPRSWRLLKPVLGERVPTGVARSTSSRARAEAATAAAAGSVVVLEHGWMLGHLPPHGPVVAVLHNVDSELARLAPASGLRRLERLWNTRTYRRLEQLLGRRADCHLTVVSARDAEVLGVDATVLPNGADLPERPTPRPADGTVLFVGSMGYLPNQEAVRWWAEDVWPGQDLPPLSVVGQGAEHFLAELRDHPGVRIVGEVADVAPHLEAARVVVVPIRSGSGTRLKVVEALAHRRPVVTTTKGAEGTGAVDGEQVLVANDALAFAAAVRRLLTDDELADRLVARGGALAEQMSWPRVGEGFAAVVARAAGQRT